MAKEIRLSLNFIPGEMKYYTEDIQGTKKAQNFIAGQYDRNYEHKRNEEYCSHVLFLRNLLKKGFLRQQRWKDIGIRTDGEH